MGAFEGQAAIVTGASRGIGEATARALAEAGAGVVLTARSGGEIERVAGEIREAGGRALAVPCDVARAADVEAVAKACRDEFGRIDVLVNNAGLIDPIAHLADADPEEWGKVIDVNVKGVFHGMRAVIPDMVAQGAGVIVNISSGAATGILEGWSHYCASKAAVLQLTRAGDLEYGDKGVRVVGLSPGTVATYMQRTIKKSGMNPISAMEWEDHVPPEWPAKAILWLCGPEGDAYRGGDVSLRETEIRRKVGLVA
ncbi:MAG: SDR family oxidoreductase [Pseudomonadota bacterium]